ncbi:uncharacterized protein LOC107882345 [Acyrthosiphon pisum]|uniref:CCHC-type domain-containing protein n=1 Tax=Acyrthosiphon pisum TaxID=7029 RepID=A0A8R2D151_ACYPI|nr:uncharacterized protein LOC107882345 [Acyrthosiphon pisum]|eukprot:XP_016656063.1 PREDICTED: uncharacterized protein LOC107882345 [Acyrthosiphon pisum]
MDPMDRFCILSYDEMQISEQLDFDKNVGKFVGYATLGNNLNSLREKNVCGHASRIEKQLETSGSMCMDVSTTEFVLRALEGSKRSVIIAYNELKSELKKIAKKEEENKANGEASNVGGKDSPLADNLATEFSSLRSEVGELSKAVRQLVDRKPEGHTGTTKRTQGRQQLAEDSEEALVTAAAWTEVVKKKTARKKNFQTQGEQSNDAKGRENTTKANPRVRARPQAIIVDVNSADFPALATKIRGGVNREVIGDSITGMRQAKSGALLIEVRGDTAQFEAVRAEISRSAGSEVEVRMLQQRVMVEVRDLDQWSTAEEVAEAAASVTGVPSEQLKVFGLRKRYGGSQSVLVSLPVGPSRELLNSGRLRVGMISCRVRLADQKQRCFRCFCSGHTAKECSGPDRTQCCRRCGESGHKVAACNALESAVSAFARSLAVEAPARK